MGPIVHSPIVADIHPVADSQVDHIPAGHIPAGHIQTVVDTPHSVDIHPAVVADSLRSQLEAGFVVDNHPEEGSPAVRHTVADSDLE